MLIAIDIGNSSINIGYFADTGLLVQRIDTHPLKGSGEYLSAIQSFLRQNCVEKGSLEGIISSVVSSHTAVFSDVLKRLSGAEETVFLTVSHEMNSGLKFGVPEPQKVGTDRIANAVAATELYGSPVAVADFGTATTITVVGREREFAGGSILPGLRLMNSALNAGTSQLKEVVIEAPLRALGVDTSECIRSGLFFGTAGAVERILTEIEDETGVSLRVVLTGGYAQAVGRLMKRSHDINSNLTLEGLRILYGKNRPS